MGAPRNRETLLGVVREVFGPDARVELAAESKAPVAAGAAAPAAARPAPSIADDPLVKDAMNRFDATNVRVTPRGRG
jgi:shikimate kinase